MADRVRVQRFEVPEFAVTQALASRWLGAFGNRRTRALVPHEFVSGAGSPYESALPGTTVVPLLCAPRDSVARPPWREGTPRQATVGRGGLGPRSTDPAAPEVPADATRCPPDIRDLCWSMPRSHAFRPGALEEDVTTKLPSAPRASSATGVDREPPRTSSVLGQGNLPSHKHRRTFDLFRYPGLDDRRL